MADLIRFVCPGCNNTLKASERKAGQVFPCPKCKTAVRIPHPVIVSAPPADPLTAHLPPSPASLDATHEWLAEIGREREEQWTLKRPLPRMQNIQQVLVVQSQPQSQIAAALVNLFFPPFGYLIQGRIGPFFMYFLILMLGVILAIPTFGVSLLAILVMWIICVVDAAQYRGR